jgi:hypothetical protein
MGEASFTVRSLTFTDVTYITYDAFMVRTAPTSVHTGCRTGLRIVLYPTFVYCVVSKEFVCWRREYMHALSISFVTLLRAILHLVLREGEHTMSCEVTTYLIVWHIYTDPHKRDAVKGINGAKMFWN